MQREQPVGEAGPMRTHASGHNRLCYAGLHPHLHVILHPLVLKHNLAIIFCEAWGQRLLACGEQWRNEWKGAHERL